MKSMTGFGRGQSEKDGIRCTVELTSVNRKQLDISLNAPQPLQEFEKKITSHLQNNFSRGNIRAVIQLERTIEKDNAPQINTNLAEHYLEQISQLNTGDNTAPQIDLTALLKLPGVLEEKEYKTPPQQLWELTEQALQKASAKLTEMRTSEGQYLQTDTENRIQLIKDIVEKIEVLSGTIVETHKTKLFKRLQDSDIELDWEDERLAKEIGIFAERCDISEELTRLHSHLIKFNEFLKNSEPVGRSLDFLTQEIFREINTISSKASNSQIAHLAVQAKTETERIREQIQNIE